MAAPTVSYTGQYKMTQSGKDWELRLLTGGTLSLSRSAAVDVFLVGGGGGGGSGAPWYYGGGGGGGGHTKTVQKLRLTRATAYSVTVGAGGASDSAGGSTSAFGYSAGGGAAGGKGSIRVGGAGGSGGGHGVYIGDNAGYISSGNGGSDGGKGGTSYGDGGSGQGSSTRAFGEANGELFAGGGGGGSAVSTNWINGYCSTRNSGWNAPGGAGGGAAGGGRTGAGQSAPANTGGGGGGGGCSSSAGGTGGSGIVILRNTRFGATSLVSAKNGSFGSPVQINLSRDDAAATHTLQAILLSASGSELHTETIADRTQSYPTVSWTPDVALYAPLIKNAPRASFQIRCITYIDGDEQGEEELDAPISLSFRAEDVAPVMEEGAVSLSPHNTGAAAGISCFIQGYSMAQGSFDDSRVSLKYGASIAKRELICGGSSSAAAPYRTGVLTGETEIIARITDSRGFTAQQRMSVKPETYARPRLSGMSIFRCDSGGTAAEAGNRISVKATAAVSGLAGENTCTLTAAFRSMYGSFGAEQSLSSGTAKVLDGSASPDETVIVRLTATDRLGGQTQYEHTLSHRKWAMKFREKGEGVAFGKAPSADKVLEIAEGWEIKRGQQLLPWGIADGSITKSKLAPDVTSAALGGVTMALLWSNPDPGKSFAPQTVSLPAGARKLFIIVMRTATDVGSTMSFVVPNVVNLSTRLNFVWTTAKANMYIVAVERQAIVKSGGIQFGGNVYSYLDSNAARNEWNIPLYIYGINF